jgi:hypothetical protein
MKSMILIAFVLVSSALSAQAAGRQEASAICNSMTFDSDRSSCIGNLKNYDYFDSRAISICSRLTFDADKNNCVGAIGNKAYEEYETESCARETFDTNKVDCLGNGGKTFRPLPPPPPQQSCMPRGRLIQKLEEVDRLVYNGQNRAARIELNDLMNRISRCP